MNNGRVGAGMLFTALYWFTRYAMGFGAGADRAGAEAAELYAGTPEEELQKEVEAFFNKELAHRMRPGCGPIMEKHLAEGERCIICTSSWQHPARSAAKLFNCETDPKDVISSVMDVDENGVLNGKIAKVAFGDGKGRRGPFASHHVLRAFTRLRFKPFTTSKMHHCILHQLRASY